MAKGSAKKPGESKCRGSGAPLEGRDWVRIGGSKWLREVAEKQGKHIPKEYAAGKSGSEFEKERAQRASEAEKAAMYLPTVTEVVEEFPDVDADFVDAEMPVDEA